MSVKVNLTHEPMRQHSCRILENGNPLVIVYNHSGLYGSWHVSLQGTCCHFSVEFLDRENLPCQQKTGHFYFISREERESEGYG